MTTSQSRFTCPTPPIIFFVPLTNNELNRMIASEEDIAEVVDILAGDPNTLSVVQAFRDACHSINDAEVALDQQQRRAARLFARLKRKNVDTKLDRFINRKRWFPTSDRHFTFEDFVNTPEPPRPTPPHPLGHCHNPIVVDSDSEDSTRTVFDCGWTGVRN